MSVGVSGPQHITRPVHIQAGDPLPAISVPLSFQLIAMTPFSTWDFFPGHHDPDFARAQGLPDIYLNTIALQGFADRIINEWTRAQCIIIRRKMAMRQPAHPGDTLTITGTVTDVASLADEAIRIEVAIQLNCERGRVCDVTTVMHLPKQYEGKVDE